jgi:hypothetical protein
MQMIFRTGRGREDLLRAIETRNQQFRHKDSEEENDNDIGENSEPEASRYNSLA